MTGSEGLNLTNQAVNELTTQVTDAPFQHGYDADNLIKIYLNQDHITVIETKTARITYQLVPDTSGASVFWESRDPSIASVDQNGVVTGIKPGDTVVTATTESGVEAECRVHVDPLVILRINPASYEIYAGDTCQISFTVSPPDTPDRDIKWQSGDTGVATVDASGLIAGIAPGTVIITGTTDSGNTASCSVTVKKRLPPDFMWTSVHYTESTRSNSAESILRDGESAGGYFCHEKNAGTSKTCAVHDVYTFTSPVLLSEGSIIRVISEWYNGAERFLMINGTIVALNAATDSYNDGYQTRSSYYRVPQDIYVNTVEEKCIVTGSLSNLHVQYHSCIFITPEGKDAFCLDNTGTSQNQNYSHAYFIGSMPESSGRQSDYSIGSDYFWFSTSASAKLHFAGPNAIDHISYGYQQSNEDDREYLLTLRDIYGSSASKSIRINHESREIVFSSGDFPGVDTSKVVDMDLSIPRHTVDGTAIEPDIYFTDGTDLRVGKATASPLYHCWD